MDLDFIRKNRDENDLIQGLLVSAIKAIAVTGVVATAIYSVIRVLPSPITPWFLLFFGLFIIVYLAKYQMKTKLRLKDYFFTTKISDGENWYESVSSWWQATGLASCLTTVLYLITSIPEARQYAIQLTPIGIVGTLVAGYIQRKQIKSMPLRGIVSSILVGYILALLANVTGVIITICTDIFGIPVTVGLLALDVALTALIVYNDLSEWIIAEKDLQVNEEESRARRENEAGMKEIAGRLRPS